MSCVSSTLGKFQGSFHAGNSSSCLLAPSPTLPPAVASSASQGAGRGARVLSAHPPPRAFLPPPRSSLLFSSLDLGHRRVLAPGSRVLGYSDPHKTAHSTRPRLLGGLCLPPTRRGAGRCAPATEVTAAPTSRKRLERRCRPFAAGRAGALPVASWNVSVSPCPRLHPWDLPGTVSWGAGGSTVLPHDMAPARPVSAEAQATWQQSQHVRLMAAETDGTALLQAVELSESPRGKLLGSGRVCRGKARCSRAWPSRPTHL